VQLAEKSGVKKVSRFREQTRGETLLLIEREKKRKSGCSTIRNIVYKFPKAAAPWIFLHWLVRTALLCLLPLGESGSKSDFLREIRLVST